MPVSGLPKAAEMALNALIEENILSSWKIAGGKTYSTVTLRFSMAEYSGPITTAQYRKKSPSQVSRDRKRQSERRNVDKDMKIVNSETLDDENWDNTNLDLMTYIDQPVTESMASSEVKLDRSQASGQGSLDQNSGHVMMGQPDIDQGIINNDQNIAITGEISDSSHDVFTSEEEHSEGNVIGDSVSGFMCDICEIDLSENWNRCTDCGIFDICKQCHDDNKHQQHVDQIHSFHSPADLSCHCDSCGYDFKTRKANYYLCQICDNYVLCIKCKNESMHRKHDDKMLLRTRNVT